MVLNVQRTCVNLCREDAGLSLDKVHEVAANNLKDGLTELGFDVRGKVSFDPFYNRLLGGFYTVLTSRCETRRVGTVVFTFCFVDFGFIHLSTIVSMPWRYHLSPNSCQCGLSISSMHGLSHFIYFNNQLTLCNQHLRASILSSLITLAIILASTSTIYRAILALHH